MATDIWFTSDTHFGHTNILQYEAENRPFKTVEEMNEYLIQMWNNVVRPNDTVYHLGDFCFGLANLQYASRLKGKKRLVLGNHDTYNSGAYLQYFDKLYGAKYWEQCILTHIPVHGYNLGQHFQQYKITAPSMLNVHGHLHSNHVKRAIGNLVEIQTDQGPVQMTQVICEERDPYYFNVSVEQHNLTPINADVIRQHIKDFDL